MKTIVISSTQRGAGKTGLIVGLTKALGKKTGYFKPIGDRMHYRKKRLWDYDAALMMSLFGLDETPESLSIGFEHTKLRYMYDRNSVRERVAEKTNEVGKNKDLVFIETGEDLHYGASVDMDAISLASYIDGDLILVAAGDDPAIMDDLIFIRNYVSMKNIRFAGFILNKVHDIEEFKNIHVKTLLEQDIRILGIIPFVPQLALMSAGYIADRTFAKVIAGEKGLGRTVKNIFIGAMSAGAAHHNPAFEKENKCIITGGDRSDMIVAALESDTSCVVLTNNILPPSNIISMADNTGIPLLLVPWDTYYTTMQIEHLEPLLTKDDAGRVDLTAKLIGDHVDLTAIPGA